MAGTDLFEEMLATYPAEKREMAREVYHRFADGDSAQFFTQLLLVLDVYARYAEHIPVRMISANADSLATVQELREEIAAIAKTIESRDVNITNHANKTDELCKITQAKCNETVAKVELMVKNIGAQMDTKAIVRGIEYALESGINRKIIEPFLRQTEELVKEVVPTLEKVEKASSAAADSWGQRIWSAAMWHGVTAGVLTMLVIGVIMYDKFSTYYERKTAEQIVYAKRVMNYNQAAFRQLAIAQVPVNVLRLEESGIINRGFALEVHNADSVETRVENGQTNGYVYFSSNLSEKQIQLLQKEIEKLTPATKNNAK
jgi:uncharacterized small protein (DUF1192 family)